MLCRFVAVVSLVTLSTQQNRTMGIVSDCRANGAKSPEFPQNGLWVQKSQLEIANPSHFPSHP